MEPKLKLVILGSMDWQPNLEGTKWFLKNVWNELNHELFELTIAGKGAFEIFKNEFGLKYKKSNLRTGEKIHEIMASFEEIKRMKYNQKDDVYLMYPDKVFNEVSFIENEYSSKNLIISKNDLYDYLKSKNFFKK
jgi:hypothetical protein